MALVVAERCFSGGSCGDHCDMEKSFFEPVKNVFRKNRSETKFSACFYENQAGNTEIYEDKRDKIKLWCNGAVF